MEQEKIIQILFADGYKNAAEYIQSLEARIARYESRSTVVEVCPSCENEIEMRWDVEAMGYRAFCPVCGNKLMLCGECWQQFGKDPKYCDYCTKTDSCRHDPARTFEEKKSLAIKRFLSEETKQRVLEIGGSKYAKHISTQGEIIITHVTNYDEIYCVQARDFYYSL